MNAVDHSHTLELVTRHTPVHSNTVLEIQSTQAIHDERFFLFLQAAIRATAVVLNYLNRLKVVEKGKHPPRRRQACRPPPRQCHLIDLTIASSSIAQGIAHVSSKWQRQDSGSGKRRAGNVACTPKRAKINNISSTSSSTAVATPLRHRVAAPA